MAEIKIPKWVEQVKRDLLHEILFAIVHVVFREMFLFLRMGRWGRFLSFLSVWGVIIGAFQTQFSSTDCVHLEKEKSVVFSFVRAHNMKECLAKFQSSIRFSQLGLGLGVCVFSFSFYGICCTTTNGIESFDTIHHTSNRISAVTDLMKSKLHQRIETSVAKPTRSKTESLLRLNVLMNFSTRIGEALRRRIWFVSHCEKSHHEKRYVDPLIHLCLEISLWHRCRQREWYMQLKDKKDFLRVTKCQITASRCKSWCIMDDQHNILSSFTCALVFLLSKNRIEVELVPRFHPNQFCYWMLERRNYVFHWTKWWAVDSNAMLASFRLFDCPFRIHKVFSTERIDRTAIRWPVSLHHSSIHARNQWCSPGTFIPTFSASDGSD